MPEFTAVLTTWYHRNKRDFPWRNTNDPYLIWISEIILQQTQVKSGLSYYNKLILSYPTINDLANATEDEILKLWQGLGYYSRARNMHFTAKEISIKYNGIFPNNYDDIIKLKGVGAYTAAAIASFAFSLPYAVVDGNVYRLLSRIFGISLAIDSTEGKREFLNLAQELLDLNDPGTHNQAMMELGSQVCKPDNPRCCDCPMIDICMANEKGMIDQLPVKSKKIIQRKRYLTYLYIQQNNSVIIQRRNQNDIWKGLYEFPLIETQSEILPADLTNEINQLLSIDNIDYEIVIGEQITHKLTHQILNIQLISINIAANLSDLLLRNNCQIVSQAQLSDLAFPNPLALFLERNLNC